MKKTSVRPNRATAHASSFRDLDLRPARCVPTVRHRVATIERCISAAAAMLDVSWDELHSIKADVRAVSLSVPEVEALVSVLQRASASAIWLSNLPGDVLDQPAPTDDQRTALDNDLVVTGGAR